MESVETRKLGKHLFIFEKGKAKSPNGKAKGRTLITSCQTDNGLPQEFVNYMRTLFDILDTNNSGFVRLSDIEACWGQKNGDSTAQDREILKQLRTVTSANGLLSFDRLCTGFGQALRSNESISIPNGSAKYESQKSGKIELNSESRLAHQSAINGTRTGRRGPVPAIQVDKQGGAKVAERFGEFYKKNGIHESTVLSPNQSDIGLNHLRKAGQKRPKSVGGIPFTYGLKDQSRPKVGQFNKKPEETIHVSFSQGNPSKLTKIDQNPKTDTGFIRKSDVRKRPKSMLPFSEQKQPVDLSVAKKKGGILEGIQKTDRKAVIDKLKQWRNVEMKNSGRNGVTTAKDFHRVTQGYQSDNEGGRQRRVVAPVCHSGSEADFDRNSTNSSGKSYGIRLPRTTVYYQGQIQTKAGNNNPTFKTKAECQEESKTKETKNSKDVTTVVDEFYTLKEGLRIVDEVRDCLVKRIADIQEQKLYKQLNNISPGNNNTKCHQDIDFKTSEEGKNFRKTGIVLNSSQLETLSAHFKGLKTVLDQAKQSRKDR